MEEEGADDLPDERVRRDEHMRVPVPDSPMGGSRLPNVKLRRFDRLREEYEDCKNEWEATQFLYEMPEAKMAG